MAPTSLLACCGYLPTPAQAGGAPLLGQCVRQGGAACSNLKTQPGAKAFGGPKGGGYVGWLVSRRVPREGGGGVGGHPNIHTSK